MASAYVTEFLRLLRGADFHVVHFHLQGANWIAKPLAALAGQRVLIAHEHSSGDLRFQGLRSLIPDASTHLFSTRIIAVSKGVRDFLTRWEAISPDLIEVVPNAVDETHFNPRRTSNGTPRGSLLASGERLRRGRRNRALGA